MAATRPTQRARASAPPPGAAVQAGSRLGRYELLVPLASGGMADVWIAEASGELGFRKLVAIKLMKPQLAYGASFRRMFLDEARLASRIHHANVVDVLDLGEEGDIVYQVMPLVQGASLARVLTRTSDDAGRAAFGPAVAARVNVDMLRGLAAAHDLRDDEGVPLGLLHRDVSPQNVLVGLDGVAKLADFGIAKAFGRMTPETEAGQLKGKLGYMAPEQLEGDAPTVQSDLFAAGVVLWESLTGCLLFPLEDAANPTAERLAAEVPDPRDLEPSIPAALADVTMRALARSPGARFVSAKTMAAELEAAIVAATHEEVARVVEGAVGDDVRALDDAVRRARRRSSTSEAATPAPPPDLAEAAPTITTVEVRPRPPTPAPRSKIGVGLGLLAAVGIAGFGVARIGRGGASDPPAGSAAALDARAEMEGAANASAMATPVTASAPEPTASASAAASSSPRRLPAAPPPRPTIAAPSSRAASPVPPSPSAAPSMVTLPPRVDATSRQ